MTLPAFAVVSVQTSINRDRISLGDIFTFSVSVISTDAVDVKSPRPPDLQGFELLSVDETVSIARKLAPGSNGMEFQNQRTKSFNYHLRATQNGKFVIGAFNIAIDGKSQFTQPVPVTVVPRAQNQPQAQPQRPRPQVPGLDDEEGEDPFANMQNLEEEMFRQLLQRNNPFGAGGGNRPQPQHRTLPVNPNEAFFIQVEVDKTEVYEGEQIVASWYIYTRGQLESLDRVKFPDLRGFWKEIIEEVPSIQFYEEIVNGVPFRKALLASHALFPLKPGRAVIDEYKVKSRVRMQQGFGYGRAYEYTKSSQRVEIKVKPLPTEGRPPSFTGAVGTFDVHSTIDSGNAPVNQPLTVHVRFEGQGNAKAIELPAMEWPKSFEQYDTKSESRYFKDGRSYKQFDILVIPREQGDLQIPGLTFSMFNPQTGKFETKTTQPINVHIGPPTAAGATAATPSGGAPGTPAAPAAPIKRGGDYLPEPMTTYTEASSFSLKPASSKALWAVMFLAVFVVLAFKAKLELFTSNLKRDISRLIDRKFKDIEKAQKENNPRQVGAQMLNVLSVVVGELVGEEGATQTIDKMMDRVSPSVRRDYGAQLLEANDFFQVLAFAPQEVVNSSSVAGRMPAQVTETQALIKNLVRSEWK